MEVIAHPRPEIEMKQVKGRGITYQIEKNKKNSLEEGTLPS